MPVRQVSSFNSLHRAMNRQGLSHAPSMRLLIGQLCWRRAYKIFLCCCVMEKEVQTDNDQVLPIHWTNPKKAEGMKPLLVI